MELFYAAVFLIVLTDQLSATTTIYAPHNFTGTDCLRSDKIEYETSDRRKEEAICSGVCRVTRAYCVCINDGLPCIDHKSCCPGSVCAGDLLYASLGDVPTCMSNESFHHQDYRTSIRYLITDIRPTTALLKEHNFYGLNCDNSNSKKIEYEDREGNKRTTGCLGVCRVTRAYCGCINNGSSCIDRNSCCPGLVCVGHLLYAQTGGNPTCMREETYREIQSRARVLFITPDRHHTTDLFSYNFSGIKCDKSNPKKLQYEDREGNIRTKGCFGTCKVREAECGCATIGKSCQADASCCSDMQCRRSFEGIPICQPRRSTLTDI